MSKERFKRDSSDSFPGLSSLPTGSCKDKDDPVGFGPSWYPGLARLGAGDLGQGTGRARTGYGRFLYEQVVPKDHFLVRLNELIPWQRFTYKLVKYYKGKAKEGRPPYDPAVILKMFLVSYLYDISERQTEEMANLNLAVKYFLGLGVSKEHRSKLRGFGLPSPTA